MTVEFRYDKDITEACHTDGTHIVMDRIQVLIDGQIFDSNWHTDIPHSAVRSGYMEHYNIGLALERIGRMVQMQAAYGKYSEKFINGKFIKSF